jgi:hypothetical protein
MWMVEWKFFFGACLLTGALVLPHAGPVPLVLGVMLAGLIHLTRSRIMLRRRERRR